MSFIGEFFDRAYRPIVDSLSVSLFGLNRSPEKLGLKKQGVAEIAESIEVNMNILATLDSLELTEISNPDIENIEGTVFYGERPDAKGSLTRIYLDVLDPKLIRRNNKLQLAGAEKVFGVSGTHGSMGEYSIKMGDRGHVGSVKLTGGTVPEQLESSPIAKAEIVDLDYMPESRITMRLGDVSMGGLGGGENMPTRIGNVTCIKKIDSETPDPNDMGEIEVVMENWYSADRTHRGSPMTIVLKKESASGPRVKYRRVFDDEDGIKDIRIEKDDLVLQHWSTGEKLTFGTHKAGPAADKFDAKEFLQVRLGEREVNIRLKQVDPIRIMEKALEISNIISTKNTPRLEPVVEHSI